MAITSEMTIIEGRSSNFSECSWSSTSSSSDNGGDFTGGINSSRSPKWKKLMKKLIQQSKKISFHGSSSSNTFRYDPVSYSLNFDDGNHDEYYSYAGCSRFSSQDLAAAGGY